MASVVRSIRIPIELSQRIDAAAEAMEMSANSLMVSLLQAAQAPEGEGLGHHGPKARDQR